MKGMLTKEFLYIKEQAKILYLALCVTIVLSLLPLLIRPDTNPPTTEDLAFMAATLFSVLAIVLAINSMAKDEQAKWDGYARSLPVSPAAAVGAKYLFIAIILAAGIAVNLPIELSASSKSTVFPAPVCVCMCAVALLICSVLLPVYYKFGSKAGSAVFAVLFIPLPAAFSLLNKGPSGQLFFWLNLAPAVALIATLASFFLSCRIYAKKET